MKTNGVLVGIVALLLVTITSCDPKMVYDQYTTVPERGWDKDSLAYFKVPVQSIEQPMNILIGIRNTADYPNSNLWLFVDIKSPSGKATRDTIECMLATIHGKWMGKGWGSIYHLEVPYQKAIRFAEHGNYEFKISHGMRSPNLKGIRDIGLRVEKAN